MMTSSLAWGLRPSKATKKGIIVSSTMRMEVTMYFLLPPSFKPIQRVRGIARTHRKRTAFVRAGSFPFISLCSRTGARRLIQAQKVSRSTNTDR